MVALTEVPAHKPGLYTMARGEKKTISAHGVFDFFLTGAVTCHGG